MKIIFVAIGLAALMGQPAIAQNVIDFDAAVAEDLVLGYESIELTAVNDNVGMTKEALSPQGGDYEYFATAAKVTFVSTSIEDAPGGEGAASVVMICHDENNQLHGELVILDGTTEVESEIDCMHIKELRVFAAGFSSVIVVPGIEDSRGSAGTITATRSGGTAILGQIPAGDNEMRQAIFMVPKGEVWRIAHLEMTKSKIQEGFVTIWSNRGGVFDIDKDYILQTAPVITEPNLVYGEGDTFLLVVSSMVGSTEFRINMTIHRRGGTPFNIIGLP